MVVIIKLSGGEFLTQGFFEVWFDLASVKVRFGIRSKIIKMKYNYKITIVFCTDTETKPLTILMNGSS